MNKFKYIELTSDEVNALKPIYNNKCCPKKCHTGEKRLWFIPKKLAYTMKNLDYTCCSYCFYNKDIMNLLNGKYKKEDLIGILCEGLECNCDESDIASIESISQQLSDGFLLSIYESGNNSNFLKINKIHDNKFNIYFDKMNTENISIILYKLIKENKDLVAYNKIMYAKIKKNIDNTTNSNKIVSSINIAKIYLNNNEFCMTLNKLIDENIQSNKLNYKPIVFNFKNISKQTIILEYSCNIDLQNKNIFEINFINNKVKYINNNIYKYKIKPLFI